MNKEHCQRTLKHAGRAALVVIGSVAGLLLLLFACDAFRPTWIPGLYIGVFFIYWPAAPVLCFLTLGLFAASILLRERRCHTVSKVLYRAGTHAGILLVLLMANLMVEGYKFSYLIKRVERAANAEEERRAFLLAARWGEVWELDRIEQRHLPEHVRHLQGDRVLRLEWLESWPSGEPFRAYRNVIDEGNLQALWGDN